MRKKVDINSDVDEPLLSSLLGRPQVYYFPKYIDWRIKEIENDYFTPDFKRIWIEVIEYIFSKENMCPVNSGAPSLIS
jgi:predicted DNA-binding protein